MTDAGAGGCGVEWTEVAALLRETLSVAEVPEPYVFVGHSISGLSCRAFAYLFPSEVAGIVLVDPFDEDTDDSALPRGFESLQQVGLGLAQGMARVGLAGLMAKGMAVGARRVLSRPDGARGIPAGPGPRPDSR